MTRRTRFRRGKEKRCDLRRGEERKKDGNKLEKVEENEDEEIITKERI
jgi:hypothetical protein